MIKILLTPLSVQKGVKKSLLVVDMPKGTYNTTSKALKNAKMIVKETSCDGVKLESFKNNYKIIKLNIVHLLVLQVAVQVVL